MKSFRHVAVAVIGVTWLAASLVLAFRTTAAPQEAIKVGAGQSVERSYPPLAPSPVGWGGSPPTPAPTVPGGSRNAATPADCAVQRWCDVIPLHLDVPASVGSDEFFVRITLTYVQTYDTTLLGGGTNTPLNQMDLYVWDDPAGAGPVAQRTSSPAPATVVLLQPPRRTYQLVVVNAYGAEPDGYKLTVRVVREALEGPPTGGAVNRAGTDLPAGTASGTPAASRQPTVGLPSEVGGGLGPTPLAPSPALQRAIDPDLIEGAQGATPPTGVAAGTRPRPAPPARPPSRVAVLLWLGVVPVGLVVAERRLLFRGAGRRRRSVRAAAPAPGS